MNKTDGTGRAERSKLRALLMKRMQEGDSDACRALLDDVGPTVMRFLRKRMADPNELEDVYQEVFIALYEARRTYEPDRLFEPALRDRAQRRRRPRAPSLGARQVGRTDSRTARTCSQRSAFLTSQAGRCFGEASNGAARGILDAQARRTVTRGRCRPCRHFGRRTEGRAYTALKKIIGGND